MPDSHARLALFPLTFVGALCGAMAVSAAPAPPAFRLGECRDTRIAGLTTPVPPDRQVELTNGLTLHYYIETHPIFPLRAGHAVRVCLVNVGTYCGFREINTRTFLLHHLYNRFRRLPERLPDTANLCAKAR